MGLKIKNDLKIFFGGVVFLIFILNFDIFAMQVYIKKQEKLKKEENCLCKAVLKNEIDDLNSFLNQNQSLVLSFCADKSPLFWFAIHYGSQESVTILIKHIKDFLQIQKKNTIRQLYFLNWKLLCLKLIDMTNLYIDDKPTSLSLNLFMLLQEIPEILQPGQIAYIRRHLIELPIRRSMSLEINKDISFDSQKLNRSESVSGYSTPLSGFSL